MTFVTKNTGATGEKIALNYLLEKGYKILKKNFQTKFGEIDLIAEKNKTVHFIEVKTKTSSSYSEPYESVTKSKLNKIKTIMDYYIKLNKLQNNKVSLDIISITLNKQITKLKIFENITN